jgi:hypothetical protein
LEALVDEERRSARASTAGRMHLLTPFAPWSARWWRSCRTRRDLGAARRAVAALARGLSKVLAWYEREGLSAFNFTLYGGPLAGEETGHPVVLRVIARTAFRVDYRTDDYFLQKQLGGELIFLPPEQLAAELRRDFAGD